MHPSEDPEQRIRDLESGVSNTLPSATPPPDSSAGTDRRWVSNVLFGLGLLIVVLGVAAFLVFGREPTAGTPVAAEPPTRTAAPPRTTTARTSPPLIPTVIPLPPSIDHTPPTVTAGGTLSVSGIDEHRTITCDGGVVQISGITNNVDIKGHCERVEVSGIENVVTVDVTAIIDASGIGNRVTFHEGAPQINTSGSDVTVEQG